MLTLLIIALAGIGFSYFATQNAGFVNVKLTDFTIFHTPLYVVSLVSLLTGLFIDWILSVFGAIASSFTFHRQENRLHQTSRAAEKLEDRVHELEIENAKLKGEHVEKEHEDIHGHYEEDRRPTFIDRLRHGLAF